MIIDTGSTGVPFGYDRCAAILDAIRDGFDDPTQAQVDAAVLGVVLGYLHKPAKLETARRHLINLWPLIAPLAERDPAAFDEILIAYSELTTVLR